MSPYAEQLAYARLEALRQLMAAMQATDDPAETRRCALAIFSAPDPCDLDDEIELVDDDNDEDAADTDESEDNVNSDSDSDSEEEEEEEEEEDSENQPSALTPAPPPPPLLTSDIAHPTSDIPPSCTCDRCRLRHHLENATQPQSLPASSPTRASLQHALTTSPPLLVPIHPSPATMLIATAGRAP